MIRGCLAVFVAFALTVAACSTTDVGPDSTEVPVPPTTESTSTSLNQTVSRELGFDQFVEESFGLLLMRSPETLTSLGISDLFGEDDDRLDDLSSEFIAATQALEVEILEVLHEYDREALGPEDQLTYDVYRWYLEDRVAGHEFTYHDWPVHFFVNSYNTGLVGFLNDVHTMESADDVAAYSHPARPGARPSRRRNRQFEDIGGAWCGSSPCDRRLDGRPSGPRSRRGHLAIEPASRGNRSVQLVSQPTPTVGAAKRVGALGRGSSRDRDPLRSGVARAPRLHAGSERACR